MTDVLDTAGSVFSDTEIEPEPVLDVDEVQVCVESIRFDSEAERTGYKDYLSSLAGKAVIASVRVTHGESRLTGTLTRKSVPLHLNSVPVVIESLVGGNYIKFKCGGAGDESITYTTLAVFFHLESEED